MANENGNIPNLPGSSGGKNPFRKKELDILDPEAKSKDTVKKGIGDVVKDIKKNFDRIRALIKLFKKIPPQAWLYIIIGIVIIFVVIGLIGFFTLMPGLMINAIKDFAQGALDTVQSWFTTTADAYINTDDVVELANYLEEMEYDLVGYGFIVPNSNYAESLDYKTIAELEEEGYIYFEKRDGDENSRYYNEAGEAYSGYYYNSLGILIDNSDGEMVDSDTYVDQYGVIRSTEEFTANGNGIIVSFGDSWLTDALDVNVDTTLLRTYLLSDYRIYAIRNNDSGLLANIYSTIKKTFGGYDSAWSKGLLKFYYSLNGIAYEEWSSSLGAWILYGDDISISRTSTGATLSVKNGHFNNAIVFEIDGWADRYGLSLEFLLSLHIATMQPDLVYAILQSFDIEVQVYLDDSGESEVAAEYVDMMNADVSVSSGLQLSDIETAFSKKGHKITSWLANNNWVVTDWLAGLGVTKKSAKDVYDYINNEMGLSLESPPNCTGQAQDQIIVLATDDTVFGWRWASTNSLNSYGLTENSEASIYDIFDEYEEYYYYDSDGNYYIMSVDNCDASLGTGDSAYLSDTYSYFEDSASGVDLADYGYVESNASISDPVINSIETTYYSSMDYVNEYNFTTYYNIYTTQEVIQTRTYTAEVDGEEVDYEWITYKYLIYKTGTETTRNFNGGTETTTNEFDESEYEWVDTIVFEFIIRDKTTEELVDAGLLEYDETTGDYIAVDPDITRCSDDPGIVKCCANCKKYLKKVMAALAQVSDSDYKSYTPYIARVLGSWFRDTYFVIPETADTAITDYINESNRSSAELSQIRNSYGTNSTLVTVDEEYLADTEEYWTAYDMTDDGDYQLYYLYPDGTTSNYTMEEFLANPYSILEDYKEGTASKYNVTSTTEYNSQEEAEEDGHAFVKKAVTVTVTELSTSTIEGVLWSAYSFSSNGAATGWIKIEYEDENEEVNKVYDIIGDEAENENGGFYYNITSTNSVTQVEDAQRSQTNATIKWLFKYRKYYTYDGSEETALKIAEDREAVLEWAESYLRSNYSSAKNVANKQLGEYGRSALRQAYGDTFLTYANLGTLLLSGLSFDWEDVTEQWLEWQLDMYYSGIVEDGAEEYFVLDDLAFIVKKDSDGNIESISSTTNLDYTPGENEEVRIGDPRNPDLISTTNITKTSLEAFTILENTKTLAAEYAYRDFKELIVELDYFDKEDLSDAVESVFTWILPDISPTGWPVRQYDKQEEDYGALIESVGTYDYLEEINYGEDEEETEEETEEDTDEDTTEETETTTTFEGYEGGEYVTSPVTGKVVEYGTHERTNVYTGETETVGYIVIEAISSSDYFTSENVSNNSGDTEDVDNEAAATGLNLFYDEYEETCAGYTITIDGFKVDLNTTDEEGNNGVYEQNEVAALYNSEEQEKREQQEQQKDDAPFFVNIGQSANLGSLPDTYECPLDGSDTGYYIKEGKYIGVTYTDEEATSGTTEEYSGPANYIRIIVKDVEYSIIDNVEDYFDISTGTSTTGIYTDLESIDENSTDAEKVRAAMSYYISQGFTAQAAAGIVGNAIVESTLNPTASNNGNYLGLFQWDSSGRWVTVTNWMRENGYNEDSFAGQIRASYESGDRDGIMTSARWDELKRLTNIDQATELFCIYYEGATGGSDSSEYYNVGTNYQDLDKRKRYAQNALAIYYGDDTVGITD